MPAGHHKPKPDNADARKRRKCLMCSNQFNSDWAGDRVCKSCRNSRAWKDGDTQRPYNVGRN